MGCFSCFDSSSSSRENHNLRSHHHPQPNSNSNSNPNPNINLSLPSQISKLPSGQSLTIFFISFEAIKSISYVISWILGDPQHNSYEFFLLQLELQEQTSYGPEVMEVPKGNCLLPTPRKDTDPPSKSLLKLLLSVNLLLQPKTLGQNPL